MMVRVAEASISEYGTRWGIPGNQLRTGVTDQKPAGNLDGELRIRQFYRYNWKAVYRPRDPKTAESVARQMVGAVQNWRYFGYGNYNAEFPREGVFDALMMMDKPDTRLCTMLANCDCTSLLGAACYFSGIYEPKLRTMNSETEDEILMGTGQFVKITDPVMLTTGKGLQVGDILWRRESIGQESIGHTCVVIDGDDDRALVPYYTTNCASVNLRSGPGTDYDVIETIGPGMLLWFVSLAGEGWAQVKYDDRYCYISWKYIAEYPKASVVGGQTWLRSEPGKKDGTEIIVIPEGTSDCYYLGSWVVIGIRKWYYVAYAGFAGWASGLYVKP